MSTTQTKKSKISFFSVMLLSAGSCIGAGIFFKNGSILSNNNNSIVGVALSWALAIVAILCMTLTFAEMVTKSGKYNSEGILGWLRFFSGEKIHKGAKNFMFYIYLTTNFFFMPYYCMMSFQDAINVYYTQVLGQQQAPSINFMIIVVCALALMLYFVTTASLSKKQGIIQNNILMYMKFIPLAFAAIGGIVIYCVLGKDNSDPAAVVVNAADGNQISELMGTWVGFGVIASVPAIFFAFDGFYTPTSSFGELQQPKKGPMALALGVSLVSFVYIMVSIGLLLSTKSGTIPGLEGRITGKGWGVTIFIMELLIAFAVMGIVNGFAIYGNDLIKEWIKEDSLPFSSFMKKKFDMNGNKGSTIYALTAYTAVFIILTVVGCFYLDAYDYYGRYTDNIYSFCDILGNWSSMFMFVFIGSAVLGGLIKKLKENEKKDLSWYKFVIGAFVTVTFVCLVFAYQTVECFYNLTVDSINYNNGAIDGFDTNSDYLIQIVVPQIIKAVTFIGFNAILLYPWIASKICKKQHASA